MSSYLWQMREYVVMFKAYQGRGSRSVEQHMCNTCEAIIYQGQGSRSVK